jgi:hypothetical protein
LVIGAGQTTDRINHTPNFFHFNNRQSSLDNHQSDGKTQSGGLRTNGTEKTRGQSPSFLIRDEAIGRRKIYREIADLIHQSKQPLHLKSEHTPA